LPAVVTFPPPPSASRAAAKVGLGDRQLRTRGERMIALQQFPLIPGPTSIE
jgi:hypothetical protein